MAYHIAFSQMARSYSLLLFLLLLTMYVMVSAMESQSTRDWTLFAVSAALCVYAHIFAVLVLSAFAVAIILPKPFKVEGRKILLVALVFEHLIAPMALFVLLHHSDQLDFLKPTWTDISGFLHLVTGQGGTFLDRSVLDPLRFRIRAARWSIRKRRLGAANAGAMAGASSATDAGGDADQAALRPLHAGDVCPGINYSRRARHYEFAECLSDATPGRSGRVRPGDRSVGSVDATARKLRICTER